MEKEKKEILQRMATIAEDFKYAWADEDEGYRHDDDEPLHERDVHEELNNLLSSIDESYFCDPNFVLEGTAIYAGTLKYANKDLTVPDFLSKAVKQNGMALEFVSEEIQKKTVGRKIIKEALEQSGGEAIKHVMIPSDVDIYIDALHAYINSGGEFTDEFDWYFAKSGWDGDYIVGSKRTTMGKIAEYFQWGKDGIEVELEAQKRYTSKQIEFLKSVIKEKYPDRHSADTIQKSVEDDVRTGEIQEVLKETTIAEQDRADNLKQEEK